MAKWDKKVKEYFDGATQEEKWDKLFNGGLMCFSIICKNEEEQKRFDAYLKSKGYEPQGIS